MGTCPNACPHPCAAVPRRLLPLRCTDCRWKEGARNTLESGGKKVGAAGARTLLPTPPGLPLVISRCTGPQPPCPLTPCPLHPAQVNENKALSKKKQWAPYSSKCTVGGVWSEHWARGEGATHMLAPQQSAQLAAYQQAQTLWMQACKTSIAKDYKYCQGCSYQKGLCAM